MVAGALAGGAEIHADWQGAPAPGQTWYAAGSGVNVRAQPSTDAPVVAELSLGEAVVVAGAECTSC